MKRNEMVQIIVNNLKDPGIPEFIYVEQAHSILKAIEEAGMRPPRLDEDKCQAIMTISYGGYTFNQWDEDFEEDEKVMEAYKKRLERLKK